MAKAILLLSGGLDSTLAGKMLVEMGISVEAVNFVSPFCRCSPKSLGCSAAKKSAEQLGIPVKVFSTGEEYVNIIKRPRFGRGKGMNPCLDCRIFIFSIAKEYMVESGADFIATGEVLGERPMSQRRWSMELIERESDLKGLILRPLTAKFFPPTKAELENLVDRQKLLGIEGRCRKPQFELAEQLGITDFLCPAGGCLLTDPNFAMRLRDLFNHDPDCSMTDISLLKYGRHFRLLSGCKVIVGRNEDENNAFEKIINGGWIILTPWKETGPSVLIDRNAVEGDIYKAAGILAAYTKGGITLDVLIRKPNQNDETHIIETSAPLPKDILSECLITA